MGALSFLMGTSVVLGIVIGMMAKFVFNLPALLSLGIAFVTMIGMFLVVLVLNSITYKPPKE